MRVATRSITAILIISLLGVGFVARDHAATAYPGPPDCLEVVSRTSAMPGTNAFVFSTQLSGSGRFVTFDAGGADFGVPDTNSKRDVYLRDLQTGSAEIVSIRTDGQQSNGDSIFKAMSTDARFVAFYNPAGDLVDGSTDSTGGVYVRDRQLGTTTFASVLPNGVAPDTKPENSAVISDDGRLVAFFNTQFLGINGFVTDLYLRDLVTNSTQQIPRNTGLTFGDHRGPLHLANDGSSLTYLIGTSATRSHVFRFHTVTSTVNDLYTVDGSTFVASSDGRYVVLTHRPPLGLFETPKPPEVHLLDTLTGASTRLTAIEEQSVTYLDDISADGRLVLYFAAIGDRQVLDRSSGVVSRVGRNLGFAPGSTTMSDDGRYLASTSFDHGGAAVVAPTIQPQLAGGPFFVPRGGRTPVVIYGEGLDATMTFSVDGNPFTATAVEPGPTPRSVIVTFSVPKNTPTIDYRLGAITADGCPAAGSSMLVVSDGGEFISQAPQRILDTRTTSALGEKETRFVPAGFGASGMLLNITVTNPTGVGYLTVFPPDAPRPLTSSINFTPGQTVANLVVLGTDGVNGFNIYNSGGTTQVIVDVLGIFAGNMYRGSFGVTSGRYVALNPTRVLDTRLGSAGKVPGDVYFPLPFRQDLGINGALMNLTAAEPEANGYFIAWPEGQGFPSTSNVNFAPGDTVANLVGVGTGGPHNAINLGNVGGATHMIADLQGVFTSNGEGDRFQESTPFRVLDTRSGLGAGPARPVAEDAEILLNVRASGVPAEASAIVMNVTVNQPTSVSYISVWPSGGARPAVSNINFVPGQTVANAVVVPIGPDGSIRFYNAFGTTHILADVMGWFT
jgi:hypothetical protein